MFTNIVSQAFGPRNKVHERWELSVLQEDQARDLLRNQTPLKSMEITRMNPRLQRKLAHVIARLLFLNFERSLNRECQNGQEKQSRKLYGSQPQFIPEENHGTCPLGSHFWTCEAEGDQEEPAWIHPETKYV